MAIVWYYIPKTQTQWECEAANEVDALDIIKDIEGIKRVPPTWKIFIEKNGIMVEVNRKAIARRRIELKNDSH